MHRVIARTTATLAAVVTAASLAPAIAAPTAAAADPSFATGSVVVKVDPGAALPAVAGVLDVTPGFPGADADPDQADLARWMSLDVLPGTEATIVAALEGAAGVTTAERVPVYTPAFIPNDPRVDDQWYLSTIRATAAWDRVRGTDLRIGVIDTQYDTSHPDLAPRLEDLAGRTGRVEARTAGCRDSVPFADHGTQVAGTAGALADNGRGVAGVAFDARIVAVQAGVEVGGTCLVGGEWVQALRDLADAGVPVVNLSFASPDRSEMVSDVVRYATNQGTLVVAAAGNSASSAPHYPAAEPQAVAVGGTIENDALWSKSNYGSWVDIAAPADRITTTCPGGGYCLTAGTSIASPMVAGAALLLADAAGTAVRGTRLRARLLDAAARVDGQVLHPNVGRGRVDARRGLTSDVVRLFGAGRIETAVAISAETNATAPNGQDTVVRRIVVVPGNAPGENGWKVTLPAAGLLSDDSTAVIVTAQAELSPAAAEEIERLAGGESDVQVLLPGDRNTGVSAAVEAALSAYDVRRIGNGDPVETAARLADAIVNDSGSDRVLVARGDTFADALSLAGPAAAFGYPLLFVNPTAVPAETCEWLTLNDIEFIHVAGGKAAIADSVLSDLRDCGTKTSTALLDSSVTTPTVTRDAGDSRVETAVAIARRHFGTRPDVVAVANGWKWPDAVTGGSMASAFDAPILVLPSNATALPAAVASYVADVNPTEAFVLGGSVVVSDALEADMEARI